MNTKQKGDLIWAIIAHLRFHAEDQKKAFDAGDTFFSLCFKTDEELFKIARLCGV